MDDLVLLAKNIAYIAHNGQYRRDGNPYFMHPYRVSNSFTQADYKVVALLHDVLEDTRETSVSLHEKGIPVKLISIIEILSKSNFTSYEKYLTKIKQNTIALEIKKIDILDNLSDKPSEKQILKYAKALQFLYS